MIEFFNEHYYLISQIFGFSAMATAIIMYQFKKHKTIMLLMVLCSSLWCCHFACLGLFTPVGMNFINVVRSIVYANRDKKYLGSKAVPYIFIAVFAVVLVLTWSGPLSILTFVASIFATISNSISDTRKLKLLTVPVCVCWFIYNCANHSVAGMCNETFAFGSIVVYFVRSSLEKKKIGSDGSSF